MKIVVLGNDVDFETLKSFNKEAHWVRANDTASLISHVDADAFFDLREEREEDAYQETAVPFFVHSVINSIDNKNKIIRINAWDGFLQNTAWEIAGSLTGKEKDVLDFIGRKIIHCVDEPGFISARIIAMIINEAYFAKGDNVSTEAEIDTAMKLGTNYPYGPFEWAKKIGVINIYKLLKKLSLQDIRYQPAPELAKIFEN